MRFDIQPNLGAIPVTFGTARKDILVLVGKPISWDKSPGARIDHYGSFHIGYDRQSRVNFISFVGDEWARGEIEVAIRGTPVWTLEHQPDPIPWLLALDPQPVEVLERWYFLTLGIFTAGYHSAFAGGKYLAMYSRCNQAQQVAADTPPADTGRYRSRSG